MKIRCKTRFWLYNVGIDCNAPITNDIKMTRNFSGLNCLISNEKDKLLLPVIGVSQERT